MYFALLMFCIGSKEPEEKRKQCKGMLIWQHFATGLYTLLL